MAVRSRLVAEVVGGLLLLISATALVWAFSADLPSETPSYALESNTILRLEWALAAIIAAAIPLLIIGRLLTGRFPDRISTQGAEWLAAGPEIVDAIDELQDNVDDMELAIDGIVQILSDQTDDLVDHERRLGQIGA